MSMPNPKTRKPRGDAHYTREEILVINKYKEEYKEQTTRELRANIFKTKILVDLFNFWLEKGIGPKNEEESADRMKELAAWVRNNWRPYSTTLDPRVKMKVNPINVVWQTQKESVEDELRDILKVDQLDPKDPGYFQQRNAAAKRVIQKMTEQERTELATIVEERRSKGNPDHIRRERANRYRDRSMQTWSKERWLDMGLATIIFSVHSDSQGRLVADVHDDVLENMGLTGKPFVQKHEPQVTEIKRLFLDHMKSLRLRVNQQAHAGPEAESDSDEVDVSEPAPQIKMTAHGFPILPNAVMEKELSKTECENLFGGYLSQHYYLATGKKHRRVPFGALKEDTRAFIDNSCIPLGTIIQQPRNMHQKQIQTLLRHWYRRQEVSGPETAFRFQLVSAPRRKRLFVQYPVHAPIQQSQSHAKDKGKQRQITQLDNLLRISQTDAPTPDTNLSVGGSVSGQGATSLSKVAAIERPVDELATIDMGQMVMLRELGYEVFGPINGPNEGLPRYEVPKSWLKTLESQMEEAPTPSPFPTNARPYPRPRPIQPKPAQLVNRTVIDPALEDIGGPSNINYGNIHDPAEFASGSGSGSGQPTHNFNPAGSEVGIDESILNTQPQPTNIGSASVQTASGGDDPVGSGSELAPGRGNSSVLGKRSTTLHSPPQKSQTKNAQRRKVVTRDDLAMLEAQELLKGVTSRRTIRRG